MTIFDKYGVLEYLNNHFEILHTQSWQWIIEEIDEFIELRKKRRVMKIYHRSTELVKNPEIRKANKNTIMISEINQNNLYLLLPSKISWLATMLAEEKT